MKAPVDLNFAALNPHPLPPFVVSPPTNTMMPAPPAPNFTAAPAAGHAEAGQHSAVIADALSTFLQGDRYIALYAPPDGWEGENTSLAEWKEVCKIYPREFVYTWVRKCHENDSGHFMSMPENRNWPEVRIRIKIPVQDDPTCTFRLSAPMKLEALWACFPNTHHNHFRTKLEPLGVEVVGRAPIPEEQLKSILLAAFPDTPHRHVHW